MNFNKICERLSVSAARCHRSRTARFCVLQPQLVILLLFFLLLLHLFKQLIFYKNVFPYCYLVKINDKYLIKTISVISAYL